MAFGFDQAWLDARQQGRNEEQRKTSRTKWGEGGYNPTITEKRSPARQAPPGSPIGTPAGASKHRNRKVFKHGFWFDSEKEADHWPTLLLLEQVGAIRDLRRQVSFDLYAANGERIARYVADFVYHSVEQNRVIIEDVKSEWTRRLPVYRLKCKLMAAQGQPITEIV